MTASSLKILDSTIEFIPNQDGTITINHSSVVDPASFILPTPAPIVLPAVTGAFRYWQYVIGSNGGDPYVGLQELKMFTVQAPTVNVVSSSSVITQSSYYTEGTLKCLASKLADGNLTDGVNGAFVSGRDQLPLTITLDLGKPLTIGSFSMLLQQLPSLALGRAPHTFILNGSNDTTEAKKWTAVSAYAGVTDWKVSEAHTFSTNMKVPPVVTAPVPAPTPAPVTPVIVAWDISKGTLVATESGTTTPTSYTPTADGTFYWGAVVPSDGTSNGYAHKAGSYFFPVVGKKGVPIVLDFKVRGDPIPGVAKSLYLVK